MVKRNLINFNMMKRVQTIVLVIILLLSSVVTVFGEEEEILTIDGTQTFVELPEISLYLDVYNIDDEKMNEAIELEDIQVLVDGKEAEVISSVPFSDTDEGVAYTFLIDISKSITADDFEELKSMLSEWIIGMNANDAIAIITFGEEVKILSNYTTDKESITTIIDDLKADEYGTTFYSGITKALEVSRVFDLSLPQRRVIYTVTDGQDDTVGNVNKEELISNLKDNPVPVYSLGIFKGTLTDAKKEGLDTLSEISRASGGSFYQMGEMGIGDIKEASINSINACNKIIVEYDEGLVDGKYHDLYIAVNRGDSKFEDTLSVLFNNRKIDSVKPEVLSVTVEGSTITVTYSEAMVGAEIPANYVVNAVTTESDTEDVTPIAPEKVSYNETETTYEAVFTIDSLTHAEYVLSISNMKDASFDENILEDYSYTFANPNYVEPVVDEELNQEPETSVLDEILENPLYIAIIVVGLVLLLVIIILLLRRQSKKKRVRLEEERLRVEKEQEDKVQQDNAKKALEHSEGSDVSVISNINNNPGDPEKIPGLLLHFAVIDANKEEQIKEVILYEEVTIGRSSDCDLTFDDDEMSRKHCKVFLENGFLVVEDLMATNTTVVNGVPIHERIRLENDDVLLVGQTELRVSFFAG